jgi:hypothetical protein
MLMLEDGNLVQNHPADMVLGDHLVDRKSLEEVTLVQEAGFQM